jgi:hypothetical protein
LDISYNPILKVTENKAIGQKRLEEEARKPGGGLKKGKKRRAYLPACYSLVTALTKSPNVKEVILFGLVVDVMEWQKRLLVLKDKIRINWRAPDAEHFRFGATRPPPPPQAPPIRKQPAKKSAASTGASAHRKWPAMRTRL